MSERLTPDQREGLQVDINSKRTCILIYCDALQALLNERDELEKEVADLRLVVKNLKEAK